MCVSDKFKDKIDVPFWEKVHQEYMTGVKIPDMLKNTSFDGKIYYNKMYYYFDKLGLPRRDKKPSRNNPQIAALRKGQKQLRDKGLKKCSRCENVKPLEDFNAKREGSKKTHQRSMCNLCINEWARERTDKLRGKPKELTAKPKELTALQKGYKKCPKCSIDKALSEYYVCKLNSNNPKVAAYCKSCSNVMSRVVNMTKEQLNKRREYDRSRQSRQTGCSYRKRIRKYGCDSENISKSKVFERDNYRCYLCGIDVVVSKTYRKDQATIDHVTPLSKGGSHTYDNVKTCCHSCNVAKGNKT